MRCLLRHPFVCHQPWAGMVLAGASLLPLRIGAKQLLISADEDKAYLATFLRRRGVAGSVATAEAAAGAEEEGAEAHHDGALRDFGSHCHPLAVALVSERSDVVHPSWPSSSAALKLPARVLHQCFGPMTRCSAFPRPSSSAALVPPDEEWQLGFCIGALVSCSHPTDLLADHRTDELMFT